MCIILYEFKSINNDFGGRGIRKLVLFICKYSRNCVVHSVLQRSTPQSKTRCPSYFIRAPLYTSSIVEDHPASKNDDHLLRAGLSTKNKKLKRM
uniref:Uncharacterized protein n=1 Tax=Trichogramma kaykai TaxID=54128 RepID=A0ABD2XDX0_9HYME